MKAVILAGGYGTRISEESGVRPKPMVEIGGKPILWHIMKTYDHYGIKDFIICCGYKSHVIKEYFANYALHNSDITFDLKDDKMIVHRNGVEDWKVTLIETGEKSMTGGRLKKVQEYVGNETFCMTYGDGVANVNIKDLIDFHKKEGVLATVTAVQAPGRFGSFTLGPQDIRITNFREKADGDGAWISGGYFVLEPKVFDLLVDEKTIWEQEPMRELSHMNQMSAFRHTDFWHPMDTLRDKHVLEAMWSEGKAPWKVWE